MEYETMTPMDRSETWSEGCRAVLEDHLCRLYGALDASPPSALVMLMVPRVHAANIEAIYRVGISKINARTEAITH